MDERFYNGNGNKDSRVRKMVDSGQGVEVTYFSPRRVGPELEIEDAVVRNIPVLITKNEYPLWACGSLQIGAGRPDVLVTAYAPGISRLTEFDMLDVKVMSCLRRLSRARLETICRKSQQRPRHVSASLEKLICAEVIINNSEVYSISEEWRNILPEIITIEAKARDWQRAIPQAARNRIFSHKSFIALPARIAERIKAERVLNQLGLGLLSVDGDHEVRVLRRPRQRPPSVWEYYYQLAAAVVNQCENL